MSIILAFDTSCDDTSCAILGEGKKSNIVISQNFVHEAYGGIMPEQAARTHFENIDQATKEALKQAQCNIKDIDFIAVTIGPGLLPSLLVGVSYAKGLAYRYHLPIIPINHIEGHIFANFIENDIDFPFIVLIVSGAHTHLFLVEKFGKYQLLGKTLDDAVGEAFDKVARILGLGYPGGPVIDRLSKNGNPYSFRIPKGLSQKNTLNFSFSGVKTYVKNLVEKSKDLSKTFICDVAASFQKACVDVLCEKTLLALKKYKISRLVLAGGVSANSLLRQQMSQLATENNLNLYLPSISLCTDNALMIAKAAQFRMDLATFDFDLIDAKASLNLV
ncbi:tRNA (adenosine(37)-N6)-threonylcarbamoyltransferase complex transferase subunit TsaD [Desulfurella sp.]|uniref:tRNA (adenosine(37)-N6)-threonylcarbamoyltransferase complex transferase subunit TsaD n=1 Tax=Desulfurella sp. TaxID=1962857 RepID=UPI0025C1E024|nr:tRNA (adenosine(37)-N6)-threonylcarbamoyltransferase complex transferase subunit TsaD [Desulfurella sp.]